MFIRLSNYTTNFQMLHIIIFISNKHQTLNSVWENWSGGRKGILGKNRENPRRKQGKQVIVNSPNIHINLRSWNSVFIVVHIPNLEDWIQVKCWYEDWASPCSSQRPNYQLAVGTAY